MGEITDRNSVITETHTSETIDKVYHSIWKAMGIPEGPDAMKFVTGEQMNLSKNIVSELQNAGILFRERVVN